MQLVKPRTVQVYDESFSGSANFKDDAKSHAEIKFQVWRSQQKRKGKKVIEVERVYTYRQLNEVYWKCDLSVSYTAEAR